MSRSRRYGLDTESPEERARLVLTISSADFAVEWVRPLPPNYKMVGPLLPQPPQPLPEELAVIPLCSCSFC